MVAEETDGLRMSLKILNYSPSLKSSSLGFLWPRSRNF